MVDSIPDFHSIHNLHNYYAYTCMHTQIRHKPITSQGKKKNFGVHLWKGFCKLIHGELVDSQTRHGARLMPKCSFGPFWVYKLGSKDFWSNASVFVLGFLQFPLLMLTNGKHSSVVFKYLVWIQTFQIICFIYLRPLHAAFLRTFVSQSSLQQTI